MSGAQPITQAWCPTCREMALPADDGRCVWCGTQTGGSVERAAPARAERVWHYLLVDEPGYGPVCACGGPKSRGSRRCWRCRADAGHRGPTRARPPGQRSRLTEDEILEARRRYLAGESLRAVAAALHPEAAERYASPSSLVETLRIVFHQRGWAVRPRAEASAAGSAARASGLSKRELRIRRGELLDRPLCAGVRRWAPRKGAPCQARAMADSPYCVQHDPARAAERAAQLAAMRDRIGRAA